MQVIEPSTSALSKPPARAPQLHHIAIQTEDLDNCVAWYQDFFGGSVSWSLSTFSPLTHSRLPGIRKLIEMVVGNVRLHLFERPADRDARSLGSGAQFQHVCVHVDSHAEMVAWRDRWIELHASGRHRFAVPDQPTEIVVDAAGVESFYTFDVNGLEYEFTYLPGGVR